jgi:hypothetical protein
MSDIDLGPGAAQVWEFLPRVARITPDEALRLIREAAALEREGRTVAVERAQACLALASGLSGSADRGVHAAVSAAFHAARESAAWKAAADLIWVDRSNPRRSAEATGAHASLMWDTQRVLEGIAACLAVAQFLDPPDVALVLAPWHAIVGDDEPTVVLGGM